MDKTWTNETMDKTLENINYGQDMDKTQGNINYRQDMDK